MIADCIALYDHWMDEKTGEDAQEMADERRSVELALQNMDALGLTGGTIYIDGKLCAFTIGERLHECEDVELINREEDMGIEGMRKAKRSYNPVKMIEKYLISTRDLREEKGIWGKEEA